MVKSHLAAQLSEAAEAAGKLNEYAREYSRLKGAFASDLAVGVPGGAGGAPGASPGAPGGSVGSTLRDVLAGAGGGQTIGSGDGGGDGGRLETAEAPASAYEKSVMETLGRGLDFVRDLFAAARFFRLNITTVLNAPSNEQDALVDAWREATQSGSDVGAGSGNQVGASRLPTDIGGGAAGAGQTAYGDLVRHTGESQASSTPAAVTAGAQATVQALGSVVTELKRLNDNVTKKSTGVEFRTGGLS